MLIDGFNLIGVTTFYTVNKVTNHRRNILRRFDPSA